jgi:hypothetical protein
MSSNLKISILIALRATEQEQEKKKKRPVFRSQESGCQESTHTPTGRTGNRSWRCAWLARS